MMPGHNPSLVSTSLWQTPQAWTFTRTSPGPGLGMSRSTISHGPWAFATCTTFIFFADAIEPPQNEFRVRRIDCDVSAALDARPIYQGARNSELQTGGLSRGSSGGLEFHFSASRVTVRDGFLSLTIKHIHESDKRSSMKTRKW